MAFSVWGGGGVCTHRTPFGRSARAAEKGYILCDRVQLTIVDESVFPGGGVPQAQPAI